MPLIQPGRETSANIAAATILAGPTIYLILENWVSKSYKPSYSYFGNFTSDLAVPYPFAERTVNRQAVSQRAPWMRFNFLLKGASFAVGHLALLHSTSTQSAVTYARGGLIALYTIGIVLVANVPGGPREHENGSVLWHSLGAMTTITCGNVSCILAGIADPNSRYARTSIVLGVTGLCNLVTFVLKGRTPMKGFWQRASMWTVHSWEYMTGCLLLTQVSSTVGRAVAQLRAYPPR